MKFSIITATNNSDRYLQKNIESLKNQTHQNWEHIFVDGFSSDNTKQIITNYKNKFPEKVKFFETPPKGISNAMNVGIQKATGDYLIHLHSDDSLFDPTVLEDVNNFLENNNVDWIYGKSHVVESDGKTIGIWPNKKIHQHNSNSFFAKQLLRYMNFIPHQAVFIKPDIFAKFGNFDESISSSMDRDFWLRIIHKTKWTFFNRTICNYALRNDAQSSSNKNKSANEKNYNNVQKRHLNKLEYTIAKAVNQILNKIFNNRR